MLKYGEREERLDVQVGGARGNSVVVVSCDGGGRTISRFTYVYTDVIVFEYSTVPNNTYYTYVR